MLGETIISVLEPKFKNIWCVLITDKNAYYLKLGGYELIEKESINFDEYSKITLPSDSTLIIKDHLTDDFDVFYFLENDIILESGEMYVTIDGIFSMGVMFRTLADFEKDFFKSDEFLI